jgi:calcineurin-like phosphoesterase family protein
VGHFGEELNMDAATIWFTADLHLNHFNILRHTRRPFVDVEEMDTVLVNNWNDLVAHRDLVYILGDLAWKQHAHFIHALNGRKILIRGNHDKMNQQCLRNFTEVHDILQRNIDDKTVVMCHYPLSGWNGKAHGSWHFFGHTHGRTLERLTEYRCDVGVDVWDFAPVPWEVLRAKMEARDAAIKAESPKFRSEQFVEEMHSRVAMQADVNSYFREQYAGEEEEEAAT